VRGFAYDVANAVLAADANDVVDALARAEALTKVRPSQDFESIAIAFKRIKNILRQARESGKALGERLKAEALQEQAEKKLETEIPRIASKGEQLRKNRTYEDARLAIGQVLRVVDPC